jgi:tetratricopeptide (TPR) repeat protein
MAHQQLGQKDQARKWYDRAARWLEQHPPSSSEQTRLQGEAAELLGIPGLARGSVYAARGDQERAAADYALVFEQGSPKEPWPWQQYAWLLLQVGDNDGYQKLCRKMHKQFGKSKDQDHFGSLARTCVLGPNAPGDTALVLRLAEQRLGRTPPSVNNYHLWSIHVLALAQYRAGEHRKAVERLSRCLKEYPKWEPQVMNWLVLAMAHKRLGRDAEAREWFDRADRWVRDRAGSQVGHSGLQDTPGEDTFAWLGVRQLHREAWTLLRQKDGAGASR